MSNQWSVTLTGQTVPGASAQAMWPALAQWFKLDEASFVSRVRERVPMSLTPCDQARAQAQAAELQALGAEAVVLEDADARRFWVRHQGRTCGPLSGAFVAHALASGILGADSQTCVHGGSQWQRLDQVFADSTRAEGRAPPPPPAGASPAQPRMSGPLPVHDQAPDLHAGFWRRAGAYLIDGILLAVVAGILGRTMGLPMYHWAAHDWSQGGFHYGYGYRFMGFSGNAFSFLAGWLYYALMESSSRQATLGKMALGLVVTDTAGRRLSFGRATARYFGMLLSWFTLTLGFMLAGWTARKQALHDLIADALVVTSDGLKRQFAERG